jgi:hypothetical protein
VYRSFSIEVQWLFRTIKQVILRENNMFSKIISWWKQIAGMFGRRFWMCCKLVSLAAYSY